MSHYPKSIQDIKWRAERTADGFLVSKLEREQARVILRLCKLVDLMNEWSNAGKITGIKDLRIRAQDILQGNV